LLTLNWKKTLSTPLKAINDFFSKTQVPDYLIFSIQIRKTLLKASPEMHRHRSTVTVS